MLVDAAYAIVATNEAAARVFDCTQTALLGQPLSRFVPESRRTADEAKVQAFEFAGLSDRRMLSQEAIRARRADGGEFPAEISISRVELLIDGRQRAYFVAILRDLSDERDLRVEVAKLNARMRAVLDLMPVPIWIIDAHRIVYANRTAAGLFGLSDPQQLIGRADRPLDTRAAGDQRPDHAAVPPGHCQPG